MEICSLSLCAKFNLEMFQCFGDEPTMFAVLRKPIQTIQTDKRVYGLKTDGSNGRKHFLNDTKMPT